jgi:hypothetical protein
MELAIVMLVVGVVTAGAINIARPILIESRLIETQQKLENISRAIDFYATQNNRVPCPSSPNEGATSPPFGFEAGSGASGNAVSDDCGAQLEGVVPYKTLGIPVSWTRDAWGAYITYAVSPGFARDTSKNSPDILTHARCRTADWFTSGMVYDGVNINKPPVVQPRNPRKARFCCSGAGFASDFTVRDVNNAAQIAKTRQSASAYYASASTTYPDPPAANARVPFDDRAEAPVYILISHGPNRYGAYTGKNITRWAKGADITPDEDVNVTEGTRVFYEIPPVARAGAEKTFDDLTLWRSQDMIFAGQGRSCALP